MLPDKIIIIHDDLDYKNDVLNIFEFCNNRIKTNFNDNSYIRHLLIDKRKQEELNALTGKAKDEFINTSLEGYRGEIQNAKIVIILINTTILSSFCLDNLLSDIIHTDILLFSLVMDRCDWQAKEWVRNSEIFPMNGRPFSKLSKSSQTDSVHNLFVKINDIYDQSFKNTTLDPVEPPKIFISYSHKDADFAELLKYKLEEALLEVIIDKAYLKMGDNWMLGLDQAIKDSDFIIVVCSAHSKVSEYVIYEWSFALGLGKRNRILPLIKGDCELHPKLKELDSLNFSDRKSRPWERLISDIKNKTNKNLINA